MAQTVCILPNDDDRQRLAAIIADRNRAQKIVNRARIIVASMDRQNVAAISRVAGVSRPAVWRWQRRYAEEGIDGLLRDKTRSRHPRWTFHFTPTSGSWLNAVEGFFSKLTRQRLKRGVFCCVTELQAAINQYLTEHNADPKPFLWNQPADKILEKLHPPNEPVH